MTVARPTRRHKPAEFTSIADFLEKRSDRGWAEGNLHASGQLPYTWVTPVLGSGCTNSGASQREVKAIASAIRAWVSSNYTEPTSVRRDDWGVLAGEFMDALIEERASLGGDERSQGDQSTDMAVEPWLGYLTLAGAVLTRLYYGIRSESSAPPLRRHLDDDAHARADLVYLGEESQFIASCKDIVGRLRDAVGSAPDDSPVKHINFLAEIDENLSRKDGGVVVKLAHLRSLCELAWLALANYSATTLLTYPGWSDLLAHLSTFSEKPSSTGHPSFEDITTANGLLSALYRELSTRSLEAGSDRPRIFGATAQLLKEQAKIYAETDLTNGASPPAVAFSTSFDVELEAALSEAGQAFILAIPVYATVTDGQGKRAYPLWIACRIGGDDGPKLTDLIGNGANSDPDQWKLLTDSYLAGFEEKLPPVVVRLAGCPIVNRPSLRPQHLAERAEHAGGPGGTTLEAQIVDAINANVKTLTRDDTSFHKQTMAQLTLSHAVVINEHDAVLQNALDTIAQPDGHPTNGLPLRLIHDTSGWERYWVMVGVQVRDTAVRHRVAALISTVRVQGTPRPQVLQRSIGLIANTSLTDVETDLFIWSGFDVAHGPDVTADRFTDVIRKSTTGLTHLRDLAIAAFGKPASAVRGASGD